MMNHNNNIKTMGNPNIKVYNLNNTSHGIKGIGNIPNKT